ncbi:DUF4825 domain-containing protein [Dubosiella newyorkensis]|jgi:hypothetical protein|uniref:DUF4825 domain-containing protein n=2 Tax=Dubosiella newyorkensis TaxID=1862672 RepID=UPI0023565430|nr:zf-HC2 domain-containing protein [Dubosiella newyorkensis]MCI9040408.1 DUF4825 domain-containing protein [Dubosiella newyorkensis]
MEENKLHILVKDLLPDYIDGLTSPETNKIIEEHLFQCSSCQKALERMKESPSILDQDEKIEFDYLKLVRKRSRRHIWLSVCIVLVIVVSFLTISTFWIGRQTPAALLNINTTVAPYQVSLEVECLDQGRKVSRVEWKENGSHVQAIVFTVPGNDERKTFMYTTDQLIENVEVAGQIVWEDGTKIPDELGLLHAYKVEYIGNASQVSHLLKKMNVSSLVGSYTFELDGTRLIIETARPLADVYVNRESLLILSLIENASSVTWKSQGKKETVSVESLDTLLKTEIKEGYGSLSAFTQNVERLEQSEEIWNQYTFDVQIQPVRLDKDQIVSFVVRENGEPVEEFSGYVKDWVNEDGSFVWRVYLQKGRYTIQFKIDGESTQEVPFNSDLRYRLQKIENNWRLEKRE